MKIIQTAHEQFYFVAKGYNNIKTVKEAFNYFGMEQNVINYKKGDYHKDN